MSRSGKRYPNFRATFRGAEASEEEELFLPDEEQAEEGECFSPRWASDPPCPPNPHAGLLVYRTIYQ